MVMWILDKSTIPNDEVFFHDYLFVNDHTSTVTSNTVRWANYIFLSAKVEL